MHHTHLVAVVSLDFSGLDAVLLHGVSTTIATIVLASFNIVFVIAVAVSLVLRLCARLHLTLVVWVDALALRNRYFELFKKCVHPLMYGG